LVKLEMIVGKETIEERAFRLLLCGSVTTPNIHVKPIMIPVIPFDGGENNMLIQHIWPVEYRDFSSSFERGDSEDYPSRFCEERLDLDSDDREHEEYMGDRENIVSIEDLKRFDQMLIGYRDDHVVQLSNHKKARTQDSSTSISPDDLRLQKDVRAVVFDAGDYDDGEYDSDNADDTLQPAMTPLITPVNSFHPLELKKSVSVETDVSSVFSTTSTITTRTPSIMKLKARKRLLERFLSDKSLGSVGDLNEGYSIREDIYSGSVETCC